MTQGNKNSCSIHIGRRHRLRLLQESWKIPFNYVWELKMPELRITWGSWAEVHLCDYVHMSTLTHKTAKAICAGGKVVSLSLGNTEWGSVPWHKDAVGYHGNQLELLCKGHVICGNKTGVTISQYHNYLQLILHIRIVFSYLHKALFTFAPSLMRVGAAWP